MAEEKKNPDKSGQLVALYGACVVKVILTQQVLVRLASALHLLARLPRCSLTCSTSKLCSYHSVRYQRRLCSSYDATDANRHEQVDTDDHD